MTSQWSSLDVGPVDGVVDGWVDPVERHDEVERPVLSTKHASNVVADTIEVRYLNVTSALTSFVSLDLLSVLCLCVPCTVNFHRQKFNGQEQTIEHISDSV